jgi:two-component system, chemotaxis family, chemotaxis protein CheY
MKTRVLLVDDSPLLRRSMKRALVQIGIAEENVWEAGNGQEALRAIAGNPVDLVLLDLNMPVMDGETFARVVRFEKKYDHIPIVIVSTESNKARLDRLRDMGINGYLHKPFEPEDLRGLLGDVFKKAQ